MTRSPSERQDNLPNRDIEELLPWYVNRTLPEAERTDVERHLAASPELRERLVQWQHLAEAVQAVEVAPPEPSPERFAALMAQIDAAPEPLAAESAPRLWAWLTERFRAFRQGWSDATGTARFALALQCALIVLFITGITLQWPWSSPAVYQTLSSEQPAAVSPRGQLRLILADEMTTGELGDLLGRIRATIVDGPSALGVYTLALQLDANSAAPEALQHALRTLRAHEHVTLAEPISPL